MAKVNFLNEAESFKSENYISQTGSNTNKKSRKGRCFIQRVMKIKIRARLKQDYLKRSRKRIN